MKTIKTWSVRSAFVVAAAFGATLLFAASQAQAGGGCHQPITSGTGTIVHFDGVCLNPGIVHVSEGDTVIWLNDISKMPHTVTGANLSWGGLDEIAPGGSYSHLFTDTGTYAYYCFLHPGMAGAVVVGDGDDSSVDAASVSLAGGAQPGETAAASTSSQGGIDHLWLFVVLSAVAAIATATGGFMLGTRRARG